MKVIAPDSFGFTVATGGPVDKGDEIEVDDETGAQLVAQGWKVAAAKKAAPAAHKKAATAADTKENA